MKYSQRSDLKYQSYETIRRVVSYNPMEISGNIKCALTIKSQNIGASTKMFASKSLISIHWIEINENISLLGHLKIMPIPLML